MTLLADALVVQKERKISCRERQKHCYVGLGGIWFIVSFLADQGLLTMRVSDVPLCRSIQLSMRQL